MRFLVWRASDEGDSDKIARLIHEQSPEAAAEVFFWDEINAAGVDGETICVVQLADGETPGGMLPISVLVRNVWTFKAARQ